MLRVDFDVQPGSVQELTNSDSIASLFAKLGYDTNKRMEQNPQHLGISNRKLLDQINHFERISENGSLRVFLIELKSVTVANTLQLARSFKEMSGFYILVLTSDYERIDFILLEKVVPIGKKKVTITQTPRFTLLPRILTVNRSDLDNVSRRVLRRFTFTEDDEYAQYDKIKSAYTIVDWGEDFFNNRALFSDYYLINRLKEDPIWKEKAETAYLFFKNNIKPNVEQQGWEC